MSSDKSMSMAKKPSHNIPKLQEPGQTLHFTRCGINPIIPDLLFANN
jgi:hypothetical protein